MEEDLRDAFDRKSIYETEDEEPQLKEISSNTVLLILESCTTVDNAKPSFSTDKEPFGLASMYST